MRCRQRSDRSRRRKGREETSRRWRWRDRRAPTPCVRPAGTKRRAPSSRAPWRSAGRSAIRAKRPGSSPVSVSFPPSSIAREEALRHYREALEIWTGLEEWRPAAWYLIEAARASERLAQIDRARELYRAAIELAERIELPYRSIALGGLARLEARAGERAAALLDGRRAVEAAYGTDNLAMIWGALYDLAEVELAFDLQESALDHLRAALAAIEALRAESVPSDRAKRAESEERQRVFARTVGLLFDLGLQAEALEVAERAKARASLDLFASTGAREAPEIAAELERTAAEAVPSSRAAMVPPAPLLIGEVRARGVTAVEYFVGEGRLFAWVIGADGSLRCVARPLAPGELETRVRAARGEEGRTEALTALHRLLIAPIAAWLPAEPSRTVLIVPHESALSALVRRAPRLDRTPSDRAPRSGLYALARHARLDRARARRARMPNRRPWSSAIRTFPSARRRFRPRGAPALAIPPILHPSHPSHPSQSPSARHSGRRGAGSSVRVARRLRGGRDHRAAASGERSDRSPGDPRGDRCRGSFGE